MLIALYINIEIYNNVSGPRPSQVRAWKRPLHRYWPCHRNVLGPRSVPCHVPGPATATSLAPAMAPFTHSTSPILSRSDPVTCSTLQMMPGNGQDYSHWSNQDKRANPHTNQDNAESTYQSG